MGMRGTSIAGELGVAVMGGSLHFMDFTYRNLASFSQGGSENDPVLALELERESYHCRV